jgi:polyisoprenyl-phosphate glycosyltransferase
VKYKKREYGFFKILISKLNNIVSSFLMDKPNKIYLSSYKCFKKNIAKKIAEYNGNVFFLDYWIFKYSNKINYINISHRKRYGGSTTYGLKQMLSLWSDMIFLINTKQLNIRTLSIKIIRFFFKIFLSNYLSLKKRRSIVIAEKLF